MDLGKTLIESGGVKRKKSGKGVAASVIVHGAVAGLITALSLSSTHQVAAEEKPIPVYVQQSSAPPPPPPPPPPKGSSAPQRSTPKVETAQPIEQPKFVQPTQIPTVVPKAEAPQTSGVIEPLTSAEPIAGGVEGGVEGGTEGGQIGGQIGGVIGGTPGGVVGGTLGGTEVAAPPQPPPQPPPPAQPSGPIRVGGDVRAPVVLSRVEPKYTEPARRARVTGTVVVEAIIDKRGNVDNVRVVRGLPMGLGESAADAVRQWKFRPGTQQGRPVDVIFNLTVVFRLGGDGPSVGKVSKPKPSPAPARQEAPAPAPAPEAPAPPPVEPAPAEEAPSPVPPV